MGMIKEYKHEVASHCESGTVRNLLNFSGVNVTEAMVFGLGSGVDFVYLSFLKYFSPFPITIVRSQMGKIFQNVEKLCNINFFFKKLKNTDIALEKINAMIDNGVPVALCVDMFYMRYLPSFLHIHVPFHFIVLYGREGDVYTVSDPYYQDIAHLSEDALRAAISTHALFSNDNLVAYVEKVPKGEIDWKSAIIKSLKRTADKMVPPAFVNVVPILGVAGIKTFAKKILTWPNEFKGLALREGILGTARGFEEQGTGGGAFRLVYGAFLKEAAEVMNSKALEEFAEKMIQNGAAWREASRKLIKIGKEVPASNNSYPEWYDKNKKSFIEALKDVSDDFIKISDFEKTFFNNIKKFVKELV